MFVVDASVAIKWFIEESDSDKALQIRNDHVQGSTILLAPSLLLYEVANVLHVSGLFSPSAIKKSIGDLYDLEMDFINPSADLMFCAVELAHAKKITVYDAAYLAIAKEFEIKLVTADQKFFSSVGDLSCVKLLSSV